VTQVAELTAQLGLEGLQQTLAGLKEVDRQVNVLREDLRGLTRDAEIAKAALDGFGISDTAIAKQAALNDEMRKTRDLALEIRAASGGGGPGGSSGFTGIFGGAGRDTAIARDAESQFRRDASTGGILAGLFGTQEAKRIAETGNNGGATGVNRGALFGLLPGGARPSQAALTTLLGLAVGGAPAIAPGVLAAAPLIGAGVGVLGGAAGTLKLAFDGLTSAAFTTQAAFDKLTPAQQQFVQTLRSLDAGLGGTLKSIAQTTLLPQLSSALHTAFSPSAVSSLSGGVGAFSNAIGGGAQDFAKLFGSSGFQDQFGQMLQQDAGYLRQFLTVFTNLTDAFVHFQVAAGPFLTWFGDLNVKFSQYIDNAIQADQANGRLAEFFGILQTSLQTTGTLLLSIGHLAGAFVDALGFQNSVALVNLLSKAVNDLADFLKANSHTFEDFFKGAIQSANDVLTVIKDLLSVLTPLLSFLNQVVKEFGGWRDVIDVIIGLKIAEWVGNIGLAAARSIYQVGLLDTALLGLGGPQVLAALAGVAAFFGGKYLGGQLAGGGSNGAFPLASPTATVNGSQVDLSFPKGDPRATSSILYDTSTGLFSQSVLKNGRDIVTKISLAQAAAAIGTSQNKLVQAIGGPTNSTGNVASAIAALAGISTPNTGTTGSSGAHFASLLQLPAGVRNALIAAQAGHGSVTAANAQAYAYYQKILATPGGLPQSVINQIYQAEAPYAPAGAFGTPGAFTPTAGTGYQVPIAIQTAISNAVTAAALKKPGALKQETSAYQNAIKVVQGQLGGLSPTDRITAQTDIQGFVSALAGLAPNAGVAFSGLNVLPQGIRSRLVAQQTRVAGIGSVGATTPFSSDTLRALKGLDVQQQASLESIKKQLDSQALTEKQVNALKAEQLQLTKEQAATEKQITDQVTMQKQAAVNLRQEQILGIGGGAGQVSAARETATVRTFLNATLKQFGLGGTGSGELGPFVQELKKNGDINQKQYTSLEKILSVITLAKESGDKLTSAITGNVSQRLAEIKQELQSSLGFSDLNSVTTEQSLLRHAGVSLTGTRAQRARFLEQSNEALQNKGRLVHAAGSVNGVPLDPNGDPAIVSHIKKITKAVKDAGTALPELPGQQIDPKTGKPIYPKLSGPLQPLSLPLSGANVNFTWHGDVTVWGDTTGARGRAVAKAVAAEVHTLLLKQARRNTTQMTGANAGRNLGAGLG
jgi:hypothetical protein